MKANDAHFALLNGRRLHLRYNGYARTVEVHAIGTSPEGEDIMRVWQVRGGSRTGRPKGWKQILLDKANDARIIDEKSEAPRPGYDRAENGMRSARYQL